MASLAVEDETEQNEEIDISLDENPHPLNDYLMEMTRLNNWEDRERYMTLMRQMTDAQRKYFECFGNPSEFDEEHFDIKGVEYLIFWNHEMELGLVPEAIGWIYDKNTYMEIGEIAISEHASDLIFPTSDGGEVNATAIFYSGPPPQPPQIPQEAWILQERSRAIEARENRIKDKIRLYYPNEFEKMEAEEREERDRYYSGESQPANPNEGGRRKIRKRRKSKKKKRKTRRRTKRKRRRTKRKRRRK